MGALSGERTDLRETDMKKPNENLYIYFFIFSYKIQN